MSITKAVLPVAGLGTRLLPASKAIPKEMITVVDRPTIQYVADEAVAAGISEIILVTHTSKAAIENHFAVNPKLEASLKSKGKQALLAELQAILPAHVRVTATLQHQPLGLGHAILCARDLVGESPFVVMLPDVLINNPEHPGSDLQQMIEAFERSGHNQIMVQSVSRDKISQYGVVDTQGQQPEPGESLPLKALVEKPALDEAPSNLAVVGRYVLGPRIFHWLAQTPADASGEIQLTDALVHLLEEQNLDAYHLCGKTYDCGSKAGYLEAIIAYGLQHPELGRAFANLMRTHLETGTTQEV